MRMVFMRSLQKEEFINDNTRDVFKLLTTLKIRPVIIYTLKRDMSLSLRHVPHFKVRTDGRKDRHYEFCRQTQQRTAEV